jgi:hypothetical protein
LGVDLVHLPALATLFFVAKLGWRCNPRFFKEGIPAISLGAFLLYDGVSGEVEYHELCSCTIFIAHTNMYQ